MSKFCSVCGASLPDDATFCTSCGAPQAPNNQFQQPAPDNQFQQAPNNPYPQPAPQQPAGSDSAAYSMLDAIGQPGTAPGMYQQAPAAAKPGFTLTPKAKKIIILGCAGAAAVAVIIILLIVLLGGGYKKPVDNLVKALETGKGEYYVSTLAEVEKKSLEEDYVTNSSKYDTLAEYYDDKFESRKESLADRYGDNFSISYSIADKKEVSESRLKSYASTYKSYFGKKVDVSAGYTLQLEVTWKGSDKDEDGDKSVTVLKVDGDWVLWDADYDSLMPKKLGGSNNSSGSSSSDDNDYDLGDLDDILDYFS
ncbi:zinc-ribbon domain-containing protein [Ruminococcaceae bacterium FB2012]|nr:zinc-ribbon domain-containing protein [Ruminococcaceae bacterium FB2012]